MMFMYLQRHPPPFVIPMWHDRRLDPAMSMFHLQVLVESMNYKLVSILLLATTAGSIEERPIDRKVSENKSGVIARAIAIMNVVPIRLTSVVLNTGIMMAAEIDTKI
jgi:hypothetical protein